jgi:hypothetical protein
MVTLTGDHRERSSAWQVRQAAMQRLLCRPVRQIMKIDPGNPVAIPGDRLRTHLSPKTIAVQRIGRDLQHPHQVLAVNRC